jgi:hypothetical protein
MQVVKFSPAWLLLHNDLNHLYDLTTCPKSLGTQSDGSEAMAYGAEWRAMAYDAEWRAMVSSLLFLYLFLLIYIGC